MNVARGIWESLCICIIFLLLSLSHVACNDAITAEKLNGFIERATSYLVRISHTSDQDPDHPGAFTYISHLNRDLQVDRFDEDPQKDYNLLRHNGAIYALAMSYDRQPCDSVKQAMLRGISYLKNEAIDTVPDVENGVGVMLSDMLAPWEDLGRTDENGNRILRAKLGGAGLGLIALCNTERIAPGTTEIEYMRKIGNFILYLQKEDGSFASRFQSTTGMDDSWTSLYYPGEAALGLVYLYELETNIEFKRKWLTAATETLLYLERLRRYQHPQDIEPDHWALLASSRLLTHLEEETVGYWLVYDHALKVTRSMLVSITEEELHENRGCFTRDRRTCPTATRLEGLIASLSFIRNHEIFIDEIGHEVSNLRETVLRYVELGIEFLLGSQQTTDQNNMMGAVSVRNPVENEKDTEVRVDYVQHSMSAIISYEMQIGEGKTSWFSSIAYAILLLIGFLVIATVILLLLPDRTKKSKKYSQ